MSVARPYWLGDQKRMAWGLLALPWLAWSAHAARQHARRAAYAVNEQVVAVRGGLWSRWWRLAEIDKLQAVSLSMSPLDRRCGTATLWLASVTVWPCSCTKPCCTRPAHTRRVPKPWV